MMRLKNIEITPPDGFRFTHPETGHVSKGTNWWAWRDAIMAHRKANDLEIFPDMMERATDTLCKILPPGHCERSEQDGNPVNTRFSLRQLAETAMAYGTLFAKKILGSEEVVSQEEADRRARLCAGCFLLARPEGCGACNKVAELFTGAVARMKTAHDALLEGKACAVCGCPAKPIVHFPMSVLEEHDTPEKQALYPKEFCWRAKESPNYVPNEELAVA